MVKRKTPEDYLALARKRNFKWLGPEVPNVRTRTWWECDVGHQWETKYNYIQRDSGCPNCASNAPKTSEEYHILANEYDLKWLGPLPASTNRKTWWECQCGYKWETRYGHIQQGHSCPVCGIEKVADTHRGKPEDYHALAKEYDFKWLGPEVPNGHTKTWWQCSFGHQWEAYYSNICQKHGCPVCAIKKRGDKLRKKPNDYHDLAEKRGFRWLGPVVPPMLILKRDGSVSVVSNGSVAIMALGRERDVHIVRGI